MVMTKERRAMTHMERFMQYVAPEPTSGCWLWDGCTQGQHRYGVIRDDGVLWRAHRRSWHLHHGPIPDGLCVLHKCDVVLCVNPDHLFLGTQADNMRDMVQKRRHANHKLTHCGTCGTTLSGSNLIRNGPNGRGCRNCKNISARTHRDAANRSGKKYYMRNLEKERARCREKSKAYYYRKKQERLLAEEAK